MMIMDGLNDTLTQSFLNSIEWNAPYGVMKGRCDISPLFLQVVPGAQESDGVFEYTTPSIAGGQTIRMTWYKWEGNDCKGEVNFRIHEITKPS